MKLKPKKKPYWKNLPEATPEQAEAQRQRLIEEGIITPSKELS